MGLVIRKKITCEFLGDEYKDAYLTFKAIPISDVASVQEGLPTGDDNAAKVAAIPKMLELLKKYFIEGKFPDDKGELEDVKAEDLDNMNAELAIHCFQGLSGVSENLDQPSKNS